jgi:hypothetical protein
MRDQTYAIYYRRSSKMARSSDVRKFLVRSQCMLEYKRASCMTMRE